MGCVMGEKLKMKEITENSIMNALDWAYSKAVSEIKGIDSAQKIAEDYLKKEGTLSGRVDSLIKWQVAKAGTSGFVTGLGGALTLPITLPTSLISVFYIQLRMIAAIAYIGGHDIKSDKVKTLSYSCLCGNVAKEILKDTGIEIGKKVTTGFIKNKISGKVTSKINKIVGYRLLTKFGEKGSINLVKCVPIVGGVIGCAFDACATGAVGKAAKSVFIQESA